MAVCQLCTSYGDEENVEEDEEHIAAHHPRHRGSSPFVFHLIVGSAARRAVRVGFGRRLLLLRLQSGHHPADGGDLPLPLVPVAAAELFVRIFGVFFLQQHQGEGDFPDVADHHRPHVRHHRGAHLRREELLHQGHDLRSGRPGPEPEDPGRPVERHRPRVPFPPLLPAHLAEAHVDEEQSRRRRQGGGGEA